MEDHFIGGHKINGNCSNDDDGTGVLAGGRPPTENQKRNSYLQIAKRNDIELAVDRAREMNVPFSEDAYQRALVPMTMDEVANDGRGQEKPSIHLIPNVYADPRRNMNKPVDAPFHSSGNDFELPLELKQELDAQPAIPSRFGKGLVGATEDPTKKKHDFEEWTNGFRFPKSAAVENYLTPEQILDQADLLESGVNPYAHGLPGLEPTPYLENPLKKSSNGLDTASIHDLVMLKNMLSNTNDYGVGAIDPSLLPEHLNYNPAMLYDPDLLPLSLADQDMLLQLQEPEEKSDVQSTNVQSAESSLASVGLQNENATDGKRKRRKRSSTTTTITTTDFTPSHGCSLNEDQSSAKDIVPCTIKTWKEIGADISNFKNLPEKGFWNKLGKIFGKDERGLYVVMTVCLFLFILLISYIMVRGGSKKKVFVYTTAPQQFVPQSSESFFSQQRRMGNPLFATTPVVRYF